MTSKYAMTSWRLKSKYKEYKNSSALNRKYHLEIVFYRVYSFLFSQVSISIVRKEAMASVKPFKSENSDNPTLDGSNPNLKKFLPHKPTKYFTMFR